MGSGNANQFLKQSLPSGKFAVGHSHIGSKNLVRAPPMFPLGGASGLAVMSIRYVIGSSVTSMPSSNEVTIYQP